MRRRAALRLVLDRRLAHRKRIRIAELAEDTCIQGVRQGSTVATLPAACREAGFEPHIAL